MKRRNKQKSILAGIILSVSVLAAIIFAPSEPSSAVFGDTLYRESAVCTAENVTCSFNNKSISELKLIPGGFPFGVKFYTEGVMVVGLSDVETDSGFASPAGSAGFKKGDVITAANGNKVRSIEEIAAIIEQSGGNAVEFTVVRDDEKLNLNLAPVKAQSDGKYKSGMWIRDSTAGIGTVTFIDPDTLSFGGLGHGICDSDTGTVMPLARGSVVNVEITDIIRGINGRPGELKGDFGRDKIGSLTANTAFGVFGVFDALPAKTAYDALPVAAKSEISVGKAQIYSSILTGENQIYEIEITKINADAGDGKNFVIKVTDPRLVELTGGIIQGMSGSPIIKDGKLVGAVTHVLVNDPTKGYGIFIENMLNNAD